MADIYSSYSELAAAEVEGSAYERRTVTSTNLDWASIAIHGGGIEPGSGEAARAVAAGLMNHYEFAGILPSGNTRLHVTSTNFDEPIAVGMVAASSRTLSFHGFLGDGTQTIALGGLDLVFKAVVSSRLTAAGFNVITAPQEISGNDPNNIVNENRILAGVQIELSQALRQAFFPGNTTSRSVRDSGARTPKFWAFVNAVRAAVFDQVGSTLRTKRGDLCEAEYTARIVDRGGATVADCTDLVSVEWNRLINDTSTAQVTVVPDGDCCQKMGDVRAWRQSLLIYRNGVFVWGGPILTAQWRTGEVEIFAADVSAWLARRVPHETLTYADDSDLIDIADDLIRDGFKPDNPGYSITRMGLAGVTGARTYTQNVGQTFDHLQDLADTGMDFTVIGTQFVLLPDDFDQSIGALSDEDMPEGLVVAEDGTTLATRWVVAGGSNRSLIGTSGGTDSYYGLLERYAEQTNLTTLSAANAAAAARLAGTDVSPVFIDTKEVTISPEAPIDVASLVPGWSLDVSTTSTCRDIIQRLKIIGVKVSMNGAGETAEPERIQVQVALSGANRSE